LKLLFRLACQILALCAFSSAQTAAVIAPPDTVMAEGIPAIPAALADKVGRYSEFRSATIQSWHPTRREMLIGTRFADIGQIHFVKMPGGDRTQLTFSNERSGGGRFQPKKGNFFIFNRDVGGGEWFQLYRHDMASGDDTLLTDGTSRNTGAVWDHTGDRIAYSSTRRNRKDGDVFVMNPADPKSDKMLLQVDGGGWGATDFSHDGKQLIIHEGISVAESYLWLVDSAAGSKKLLTPKGEEKISYSDARFAPDDKSIYFTTDKGSEFHRLSRMDLATGKITFLTSAIPWEVEEFDITDDGKTIAFVTNENGVGKLHFLDAASGKSLPSPKLPVGVIGGLNWHENGREIAFTISSARSPADVYSVSFPALAVTRWTFSETGGLNTANFSEAELVKWKSFDGKEISGFLYKPPAKFTGKRPVIINIHGGPEGQSRPTFLGRNNYFLNELGVAMIFPNVRGSQGYGKSFAESDNGFKREDTYKDIDALLDWIKANPALDGDRIMVTGGSYGGHMTLAVATNYNDKICCSLDVVGISNLVTLLQNTESYRRDLRRAEYGDERDPKMREFMERTAPINKAQNITKPLFVVAGKNDPRVPISEAEQMIAKVRANKTPVWYLVGKNEGHGFQKKTNQDYQFYATILFMQEFLLK
jgi:protease II